MDDIGQISGNFNHGHMEGLVTVTSQLRNEEAIKNFGDVIGEDEDIHYTFVPVQEGVTQGIVMTFGMKQLYKVISEFKFSLYALYI